MRRHSFRTYKFGEQVVCLHVSLFGLYHTDAGVEFIPIQSQESEGKDCKNLPVQILFNVINSALVRPYNPIKASLRFRRFLPDFVARSLSSVLSLVQLEALLFPSIFYYQASDGICPGAVPFFYTQLLEKS